MYGADDLGEFVDIGALYRRLGRLVRWGYLHL